LTAAEFREKGKKGEECGIGKGHGEKKGGKYLMAASGNVRIPRLETKAKNSSPLCDVGAEEVKKKSGEKGKRYYTLGQKERRLAREKKAKRG